MGVSGPILNLVCGLPSPKRERWPIMAVQAYIDDSMEAGRVLVFAGYISTAEKWSAFSTEWNEILSMKPPMQRFKMNEFDLNSKLQRERLRHFYRVIEDHVLCSVAVAVQVDALERLVAELGMDSDFANPYHIAHKAVINYLAQEQRKIGLLDKVDFIFDKRGEAKLVRAGFELYLETLPEDVASVTGRFPQFEDDEEFLPLQAADFLAWWARRHWLETGSLTESILELPWRGSREIPSMWLDLNEPELREELILMRERAARYARTQGGPTITMKVSFSFDRSSSPKKEK